jgi:hypothetical protein
MPVSRLIAINGSGGAFVDIFATVPVSRIVFTEDDAAARQGLAVKTLLDNFATVNTYGPSSDIDGAEPVQIPDIGAGYDHMRKLLGMPAQGVVGAFNYRAADKLLSVRSATATATTLRMTEYE